MIRQLGLSRGNIVPRATRKIARIRSRREKPLGSPLSSAHEFSRLNLERERWTERDSRPTFTEQPTNGVQRVIRRVATRVVRFIAAARSDYNLKRISAAVLSPFPQGPAARP